MEYLFISTVFLTMSVVILAAGFRFVCVTTEKFIMQTLPVIMEAYARWRYPHNFTD